jgi:predicted GIY-YIG superfamily endonuclease
MINGSQPCSGCTSRCGDCVVGRIMQSVMNISKAMLAVQHRKEFKPLRRPQKQKLLDLTNQLN